eukprot:GHVP01038787.1.p2 GENE.GHVP01038787.1~~GHVP01038787.1.p2  ORF type:complete len:108 (+),score=3.60 GHVP01038787.1:141-464(+)
MFALHTAIIAAAIYFVVQIFREKIRPQCVTHTKFRLSVGLLPAFVWNVWVEKFRWSNFDNAAKIRTFVTRERSATLCDVIFFATTPSNFVVKNGLFIFGNLYHSVSV